MTHPDILAALAHERVNTFLDEAEAARRARQAGIDRFTALVAADNATMAGLRNLGACPAGRGPGTVEYEVALVIPPGGRGRDEAPRSWSQRC